MLRSLRSILLTTVFSMVVLFAATAVAAPATWQQVDVTLHAEQDGSVLLISGTLPEKTPLPATAELSVPTGSEPQWVGEILGGPPAQDPVLKYTKSSTSGVDVYRFTLIRARTAQIEIPMTAGPLFDGTAYTTSLAWASAQDLPEVRLSLRVPEGSKPVEPAGAIIQPGQDGYSFYTKIAKNVKAGDKLELKLAYTPPAASAATTSGGTRPVKPASSNSGVTVLVLFAVIVAFATGAVVLSRRKNVAAPEAGQPSAKSSPSDSAPNDSPADEPRSKGAGAAKRNLVTAVIIGVFILGTVIVGTQTTKPKVSGDAITEVFAQGESCATATIPLKVPAGADPTATAKTLFTAVKPIADKATYNAKTSTLEVAFCESKSSESALRAALASTGLVAD